MSTHRSCGAVFMPLRTGAEKLGKSCPRGHALVSPPSRRALRSESESRSRARRRRTPTYGRHAEARRAGFSRWVKPRPGKAHGHAAAMRPDRVPCAAVADGQARAALAQIDAQARDDGYAPGKPGSPFYRFPARAVTNTAGPTLSPRASQDRSRSQPGSPSARSAASKAAFAAG
jgi:hypothetical protein